MSTLHRWKGGRSIKLEGSDHVPVYMSLVEVPEILQHSTPPLSTRYHPQIFGSQQTLGESLVKLHLNINFLGDAVVFVLLELF